MINIFLIRHGKASSGWNSLDPALDDFGKKQSKELAKKLLNYSSESYDLFSSPLLRCKQTSKPFRLLCNKDITIEDRVSEIPSPISDLSKRVIWLKRVLPLNWNELIDDKDSIASGLDYNLWRSGIIDFLYSLKNDTFIFTHFVVINSIVSFLNKSEKVIFFNPDNTSITHLTLDKEILKIISLGKESITKVN
jgi:broad specificity phosphatase PhoE|tara:strand:- start:70 stop:648 length:579 start_codon:yes stop_codon:yes gene_type:complete